MAKLCICMLLVVFACAFRNANAARNVPNKKGDSVSDEKNVVNYSGVGVYSGVGNNGMPFGGIGGAAGTGGDLGGGGGGLPGLGGAGGLPGIGGTPGTGAPGISSGTGFPTVGTGNGFPAVGGFPTIGGAGGLPTLGGIGGFPGTGGGAAGGLPGKLGKLRTVKPRNKECQSEADYTWSRPWLVLATKTASYTYYLTSSSHSFSSLQQVALEDDLILESQIKQQIVTGSRLV